MEQGEHTYAEHLDSGFRTTASRCAWSGASSNPSGNASPNRNSRTGRTSAAAMPPALNSNHRNGLADLRCGADVLMT